ncbi:MAG: hypothetical protein LBG23_03200 [Endomicrobium sp.]|nr:hypothetical protein [Endomicrobium sp.]
MAQNNFNSFFFNRNLYFFTLIIIYILKIKTTSLKLLIGFINNLPLYCLQDYIFLEILTLPIFIFIAFTTGNFFSTNPYKYLQITPKYNFDTKSIDRDSKYLLIDIFLYQAYYYTITNIKAKPELLLWLLLTVCTFILIDRRNNRITAYITLNNELIKKQTSEQLSAAFDEQKQKLQVLELNWSANTLEFLKSARHDLINDLEKSKTKLNELLSEVYDNVVKPYSDLILKNQKEIRQYIEIEDITSGTIKTYYLQDITTEIESTISTLQTKASYIEIKFIKLKKTDIYCKINKSFFIAFNNILDNSVYALQKHMLYNNFNAIIKIELKIKKALSVKDDKTKTIENLQKENHLLILTELLNLDDKGAGQLFEDEVQSKLKSMTKVFMQHPYEPKENIIINGQEIDIIAFTASPLPFSIMLFEAKYFPNATITGSINDPTKVVTNNIEKVSTKRRNFFEQSENQFKQVSNRIQKILHDFKYTKKEEKFRPFIQNFIVFPDTTDISQIQTKNANKYTKICKLKDLTQDFLIKTAFSMPKRIVDENVKTIILQNLF